MLFHTSRQRMLRGVVALAAATFVAGSLVMAAPALAAVDTVSSGPFTFQIDTASDTASLSAYSGVGTTSLVIPSTYVDGDDKVYRVTALTGTISTSSTISTVTVPASVTTVSDSALVSMTSIIAVYFLGNAPALGAPAALGPVAEVTVFTSVAATGFTLTNGKWSGYPVMPFAASQATLGITPLPRTVVLGDIPLGNKSVSHSVLNYTATDVSFVVDDLSGSGAGWQVTLESTDFVWSAGEYAASANPAVSKNLFTVKASALEPTATGGVLTNVTSLSSTTARAFGNGPITVLSALAQNGEGNYSLPLNFALALPGNSRAGSYAATVTATLVIAPVVP